MTGSPRQPPQSFIVWLAAGALGFVLAAWAMWSRHLAMTSREPAATPDAAAYEPTDEF